jgi:hypothetical protein
MISGNVLERNFSPLKVHVISALASSCARSFAGTESLVRAPAPPGPLALQGKTVHHRIHAPGDPRIPSPGTVIARDYKGRKLLVAVLEKGFEFEGRTYRSLSAVAKEVTGTHWNGVRFFGLDEGRAA